MSSIEAGDRALIQIVDAAIAEAARRSGSWLVCRLGCTQCCMGSFPISQLDALRLKRGLAELTAQDPDRAARVSSRARESVARREADDDEPCPALDPETGGCDLYSARPMTCRTFGPPVRCGEEAVGVCELCYEGASDAEIAACEVEIDDGGMESALAQELDSGETIVAYCLL